MESKVAKQVEQAMIEVVKRLTHEQRLQAFATHCQLMMELYLAGQKARTTEPLDVELVRRLAKGFGHDAVKALDQLLPAN